MWDKVYSDEQYAYGKEPNDFLVENYAAIPKGKILSLAEGEGRNAVFLAKMGYTVTAVDESKVGLKKAEKLAHENGVEIELIQKDLVKYDIGENQWEGIVSIFCPLPSTVRASVYRSAVHGLKPGGVFLLEAYTPDQLKYRTGGGRSADLMTSKRSLVSDLNGLQFTHLLELEREVIEGKFHTGIGAVLQAIAQKP